MRGLFGIALVALAVWLVFSVWGRRPQRREKLALRPALNPSQGFGLTLTAMDFSSAPAGTERIFNEIVKAAGQKQTITYGEIADAVGIPKHHLANQLWFIRDACRDRGLPWLTAIVVGSKTRKPAGGITKDTTAPGIDSPEFPAWWEDMKSRVFETDWSRAARR